MPRANLKNGILNFWRGQISDSIYHFLLVGIKRGDGFHIGFQKMDYVYFYGSSVRMGHKVYIIPILLRVPATQRLRPARLLVQPDGWARGEREGYRGPRNVDRDVIALSLTMVFSRPPPKRW